MRAIRNSYKEQIGKRTYQVEIGLRALSYSNHGSIRPIRNKLSAQSSAIVPEINIIFDEVFQGGFPAILEPDRPMISLVHRSHKVFITPLFVEKQINAEIENRREQDWVIYRDICPGADLELTVGGDLLSKWIRLRKGHPNIFSFKIEGCPMKVGPTGRIFLGDRQLEMCQPYLFKDGEKEINLTWQVHPAGFSVDLPHGDWSGWTLDPTLSLQPDSAGIDNYIDQSASTTNYGTSAELRCNSRGSYFRHTLIKFIGIGDIPSGSTITSANLYMECFNDQDQGQCLFRIARILAANSGWTEGGSDWDTIDNVNSWAGSNGCSTQGTDYSSTDMWSGDLNALGTGTNDFSLDTDEFELMLERNYGMVFVNTNTETTGRNHDFRSSDYATAGDRPKLTVVYTVPASARLAKYSINPLGIRVDVLNDLGVAVPYEEVEPDNWIIDEGPTMPSGEVFDSFVLDPRVAYIEEVRYTDPDDISISSSSSEFADVIVARAAGRSAL